MTVRRKPVAKDPVLTYLDQNLKLRAKRNTVEIVPNKQSHVYNVASAIYDLISVVAPKGKTDLLSKFFAKPEAQLALASLLALAGIHGGDKMMAIIQVLQATVDEFARAPEITIPEVRP